MNMSRARALAVASIAGLALVWLLVLLQGVLAAIPVPTTYWDALRGQHGLATLLYFLAVIELPLAVVAGIFAWCLFRLLGQATVSLVLVCTAPWFLLVVAGWVTDGDQHIALLTSGVYPLLSSLAATFSIPIAVWMASRILRRAADAT